MSSESHRFGHRLRTERERRGISLESIAAQTKIKKAYLVGLENGDFSKWPAGDVFRRAYVRDYASAIGLSPESVCADFRQLFAPPERERAEKSSEASTSHNLRLVSAETDLPFWRVPSGNNGPGRAERQLQLRLHDERPLALIFDRRSKWYAGLVGRRALAVSLDLCGLLAAGAVVGLLTGSTVWTAGGILALLYFPATTVCLGRSLGAWFLEDQLLRHRSVVFRGVAPAEAAPVAVADPAPAEASLHVIRAGTRPVNSLLDPVFLVSDTSQPPHVTPDTPIH